MRSYTEGKFRLWRDGTPFYCAGWVRDLTPASRESMFRGSDGSQASKKQLELWSHVRHPQTTYIPAYTE